MSPLGERLVAVLRVTGHVLSRASVSERVGPASRQACRRQGSGERLAGNPGLARLATGEPMIDVDAVVAYRGRALATRTPTFPTSGPRATRRRRRALRNTTRPTGQEVISDTARDARVLGLSHDPVNAAAGVDSFVQRSGGTQYASTGPERSARRGERRAARIRPGRGGRGRSRRAGRCDAAAAANRRCCGRRSALCRGR